MVYLGVLFLAVFSGFFVREIMHSFRRGAVTSRGCYWSREERPTLFWLGIAAWSLNASIGVFFALAIVFNNVR
jgi:hypothetical protein